MQTYKLTHTHTQKAYSKYYIEKDVLVAPWNNQAQHATQVVVAIDVKHTNPEMADMPEYITD